MKYILLFLLSLTLLGCKKQTISSYPEPSILSSDICPHKWSDWEPTPFIDYSQNRFLQKRKCSSCGFTILERVPVYPEDNKIK